MLLIFIYLFIHNASRGALFVIYYCSKLADRERERESVYDIFCNIHKRGSVYDALLASENGMDAIDIGD